MTDRDFKSIVPLLSHGGSRIRGSGSAVSGRGVTYTLRRLKRDRPDLLEQVASGRLSANAAAVAAGFRKVPSALEQMQNLWCRLSRAEAQSLLAWGRRQLR
jgi:hypothetical protein